MGGLVLRRDEIRRALVISVLIVLPMVLLYSFVPTYSESILVPNIPLEEYYRLDETDQLKLIESDSGLREIKKFEKVVYLLLAKPEFYILRGFILFIPLLVSSLLSSYLARRANEI